MIADRLDRRLGDLFFHHIARDAELADNLTIRQAVQTTQDKNLLAAVRQLLASFWKSESAIGFAPTCTVFKAFKIDVRRSSVRRFPPGRQLTNSYPTGLCNPDQRCLVGG